MYEFSITLSDGTTPVIGDHLSTTYFTKDGYYTIYRNFTGGVTMIRACPYEKKQGSK